MKGLPATDSAALQRAFDLCIRKTRSNIKALADEPQPKTWALDKDGFYARWNEGFFEIGNWTTSFFTGMALLAWRETKDDSFLHQVLRLAPLYRQKIYEHPMDTMHDLGFLYSLYSVALYKLTGDKTHREVGLRAAEVLAGRFISEGNYIRAWGRMDDQGTDYAGLAIIDCMMNLPLLYWAGKETGDPKFRDIAIRHADTTLKHWIRPDDSVYHSYRFDAKTGKPVGGDNYCGRAIESQWARGTAWAIYGFALSYGYTREEKYLVASLRLARKFIRELGDDVVPVWDFKLPAGEPRLVDSSAASIAVCGLQELLKSCPNDESLLAAKNRMLAGLCTDRFLDSNPAVPGILKLGQAGDGVGKARSVYTSWGDYYLMEALSRELGQDEAWW